MESLIESLSRFRMISSRFACVLLVCVAVQAYAEPRVVRVDLIQNDEVALCPDIVVAANGDLIATFETKGDALPGSRGQFMRSKDGGKNWSEVYLTRKAGDETSQGLLVSGMLRRSSDDAILMCETVINSPGGKLSGRTTASLDVMISRDHGMSFSFLAHVPCPPDVLAAPYGPMIELPNGELLLPGFAENIGNGYWISKDGGERWLPFRVVWQDPIKDAKQKLWFNETSYVVCEDGSLVSIARNDQNKIFFMIKSENMGKSWSQPRALPLVGGSPALHRMPNGDLLFACRDAAKPGIGLAVSPDNGENWRYIDSMPLPKGVAPLGAAHWQRLADDKNWQPLEGHFGYPVFTNLPNGDVYIAWHVHNRNMKIPKDRDPFCLAGAVIRGGEERAAMDVENVFTAAQIGMILRGQKRTGSPAVAQLLGKSAGLGLEITPLRIEGRDSPEAEVHACEDDLFYIIDGEATFHLGGRLSQPWTYSPGNRAGKEQLDAESYLVGPGDLVLVPRGVVHRITCPDGFVELLIIKRVDEMMAEDPIATRTDGNTQE